MSRVDSPGRARSLIEGRAFTERPGPNIPMIAGYAAIAGLVTPDVVEQGADFVGAYMKSMSFGSKPNLPDFFVPKALALFASASGMAIHTTFALLAARRQAIAPPVLTAETKVAEE